MSTRLIKINCNGTIHDDDSGDWFGEDEEENFSWSKTLVLESNGFSHEWKESHTVDGEVKLEANLRMQVDSDNKLSVSGTLELWEGPSWNMGDSEAIDNTIIEPNTTATVYEGTLADNEGDWAKFKLEVQNNDATGTARSGLTSSSSSSTSSVHGRSSLQNRIRRLLAR